VGLGLRRARLAKRDGISAAIVVDELDAKARYKCQRD